METREKNPKILEKTKGFFEKNPMSNEELNESLCDESLKALF